jgi:mannosyl-glycoprotein endo-beta-N-acetylglucosaminidase
LRTVDYFFTDYHWGLGQLESTAALSESLDRSTDIFIGNDVFGRGTYGGGMFNTDIAVR